MLTVIDTRLATITVTAPDFLEVRFKKGVTVDGAGLHEVLQQRAQLSEKGPFLVLGVLPADLDFDINVMTVNHYEGQTVLERTLAVGWVAHTLMNERMASLYLAYFPQPFPTQVFMEEEEARAWLLNLPRPSTP
jgi:hypothetical protein